MMTFSDARTLYIISLLIDSMGSFHLERTYSISAHHWKNHKNREHRREKRSSMLLCSEYHRFRTTGLFRFLDGFIFSFLKAHRCGAPINWLWMLNNQRNTNQSMFDKWQINYLTSAAVTKLEIVNLSKCFSWWIRFGVGINDSIDATKKKLTQFYLERRLSKICSHIVL